MLDTIRSFGHDRLHADGEDEAATERFLQWALHLATWFDQTIDTDDEGQADALLRRARSPISEPRGGWSASHGRLDDAVRLVVAIGDAASWRDLTEVWDWALELADDPITETHPDAAVRDRHRRRPRLVARRTRPR